MKRFIYSLIVSMTLQVHAQNVPDNLTLANEYLDINNELV